MTAPFDMPTARRAAEALMASTCTIRARSTEPATDPDTGEVTFPPVDPPVYAGKCRVRPAATWGRDAQLTNIQVTASTFQVAVPFSATGIRQGMEVRIDSSADPELVGRVFEVRFIPDMGDTLTARRLLCEEVA